MKDGGRRGEVVLWPTLRLTDRAWRLLRHSIRVLSGAAQRGAVNRANRANAHGSCLLGVVPERISGVEGQEPCALTWFARCATPHCAAPLNTRMDRLGSLQAQSGDRGIGLNPTFPHLSAIHGLLSGGGGREP